jgi:MFS family permease
VVYGARVSRTLFARPFVRATVTSFFFSASLSGFVLLPLHIKALGGREIEIGLIMGLYSGVGILCQPLIGPWVDAIGRKPFMVLGVSLVFLSALVAMTLHALPALFVVRVLQGLGFSAFFVANFSYVIDLVPPAERGWALGIYGVSGMVSTAVAPLVVERMVRSFGFQPLFAFSMVLAAVAGVLVAGIPPQPRHDPPTVRGWEGLRESLADAIERHMIVTLFFGMGAGTLFAFLPTFAELLGVRTLALFYTAYAGAAMTVRIVGGRLIDTLGRRAVIVPSMFVLAGAVALLAVLALASTHWKGIPALPVLVLAGLLAGGAHGFIYPGLAALVADLAPEARRAAVIGLFSAMSLVGQASGSVIFGYVAHVFGYGGLWTMLATILMAGAVLSLGLKADADSRRLPLVKGAA